MKSESNFEKTIGYLLISGVLVSLFLEILGMTAYHRAYGHFHLQEERTVFLRGQNLFSLIWQLFEGRYTQGRAMLLMTLGVLFLILTPYLRVILSVFHFARKKDFKYLFITLFVLIILTVSLALH